MDNRIAQVEVIIYKKVNDNFHFLLFKRNQSRGGFWQPVTGGVKPGESREEAVARELKEETGIDKYINIIKDVYYFEFKTVKYKLLKEYVFGVQIDKDIVPIISSEHTTFRWCLLDEALKLLKYDTNKTAFKKLFNKLKEEK